MEIKRAIQSGNVQEAIQKLDNLNTMVGFCLSACSVGWFVSLLVREEVLLAGLCKRKILFRLKIYDRL